jgi:WD40 repeat protein
LARDRRPIVLRGHAGIVYTAAFDPTGTRVVSAGADGTARVWDWTTPGARTAPVTLLHGEGQLYAAAFSHDGGRVAAAGDDGASVVSCTVCGPIDRVLARARSRLGRVLTPAERTFVAEHAHGG